MSFRFLRQYFREPGRVGAVAPSSRWLAHRMVDGFDLAHADVVVEFGPGLGSFTKKILDEMGAQTRFLAVELNEDFVTRLRARFPQLQVHAGSAVDAPGLLEQLGWGGADFVISGLPWASFDPDLQHSLLQAAFESLKPGGQFATFAYQGAAQLPRARRFRKLLTDTFDSVETTRTVWRNCPPAFAYHCKK